VTVVLLWLDVGLELGCGEASRLKLLGLEVPFEERAMLPVGVFAVSWWLLLLATEFPLFSPGGDWMLHLLFTLSDRFIMALCTKPPIPFVGDAGRSSLSGDIRPCEGDIARARPSDLDSEPGGSNL